MAKKEEIFVICPQKCSLESKPVCFASVSYSVLDLPVCTATSDTDLQQILGLLYQNHFSVLPAQQAVRDGFVTVRHSLPPLKEMNRKVRQVIAKKSWSTRRLYPCDA
jgi:hypothetical protein